MKHSLKRITLAAILLLQCGSVFITSGITESFAEAQDNEAIVNVNRFASLSAAITSSSTNGKEILITGNTPITTNITIPKNKTLRFMSGGKLSVAFGKTVTIDCHLEAGLKQHIFDGPGAVVFGWNSDQKVSICWKGAASESNNNAPSIQWALDQMSAVQGTVIVPYGNYKYSKPLTVYSNTTLEGQGRKFSSSLIPMNCSAIILDGSKVDGGWIFRSKIRKLTFYGNKTTDTYGEKFIYLNKAYNIEIEDVWIYNQQNSAGVSIKSCGDIVLSNIIVYGQDTGSFRKGIICEDSTVKIISPDIENLYVGIQCAGSGSLDIFSPYIERCIVGYRHAATSGTTRIYGGMIATVNGYCVDVQGDHLYVYGTDLSPYQGSQPGGLGIYAAADSGYTNVYFHDIPKAAQPGFFDRNTNWLNLQLTGTIPIPSVSKRTIDFEKNILNHVATDLLEFDNVEYANCELRIYTTTNINNSISKVYTFAIGRGSSSPISERIEVDTADKKNTISFSVFILKIDNKRCKLVVKADSTNILKDSKISIFFQLNTIARSYGNSKLLIL